MKIIRIILRVLGWTLLGVLALVVCVCALVYFPPVQRFAVDKATEILADKTGMQVSVDRFRLRFPLGVSLRGAEVVMPSGDTLGRVGRLTVNVSPNLRRLREHRVVVRRVVLAGADVRLGPLLADTVLFGGGEPKDSLAAPLDWRFEVRRLAVSRSRVSLTSPPLMVDSLELSVRDFSFADGAVSARLRQLALIETVSGVRVEDASGDFKMDSLGYALSDFSLATAASALRLDARVGEGIARLDPTTPLTAEISGHIAAAEVLPFVTLEAEMERVLRGEVLTLDGVLEGSLTDLSIERLRASLPRQMDLEASGRVRSLLVPAELAGNISLEARLADLDFARAFLPDTTLRRRLAIPRDMLLRAVADFSPREYDVTELTLTADSGRLEAKGRLAMDTKTYNASLRLRNFPLGEFLPQDSLGRASLYAMARGAGFDPFEGMAAWVWLRVGHLPYKGTDYKNVSLTGRLARGEFDIRARSDNDVLGLDLDAEGTLAGDPAKKQYAVTARVAPTAVRLDSVTYHSRDSLWLRFATDPTQTSAAVRTGDLAVEVTSPLTLDSLVVGAGHVNSEVRRQLGARHFSADSLQSAFPAMKLTASAGRLNPLYEIAAMNGVGFRTIEADVSTLRGEPFNVDARVRGLTTGKFTLDTLNLAAHRNADRLDYTLRVANRPGNNDRLGLVVVSGSAGGNTIDLNVEQRNRADSLGFRFGVEAALSGKTLRARITPTDPIFAYEQWSVGSGSGAGGGDWVEWDTDGAMRANLHLTGPTTAEYVSVTSASLPDIPDGALELVMEGLDLGAIMDLLPSAPPVGGGLKSDVTFGFREGVIAAKGTLGVVDFTYHDRRVATVEGDVDFQSGTTGRMILDAGVKLDGHEAVNASGYYSTDDMDFALKIPGVPLSLASGFLPTETATLKGSLDGNLRARGMPTAPVLSGDVGFVDAAVDVLMTGTTLKISPDRVVIADELVQLNGLGIIAPNNQKLALTGNVNIADLGNPVANLALGATNFRVVDSQHIGGSQVYGLAAFDASVTARGALSSMMVRGSVEVLGATNVNYILRNTSQVKDVKQHIVEFRDFFADSLNLALADPVAVLAPLRPQVDMLVSVDIADGVRATMSLDELSENRIALVGGGALTYSMNAQGDMRLSGRYTLSGGTIYYKPPMIGQKVFAVADGSYVEWTGEALDPEFHVTATQTSPIELTYDDGLSEQVDFDISIDVEGSLAAMDMRFDVEAPGNLAIQNQLMAMSDEERMRQALMLLISGQYNGPGVQSKGGASFDARKQIGDFISKEVNQWARNNLKGVDFQMGISSRNEAGGGTSTDYSYSVSKSLANDRVKITVGGSVNDGSAGGGQNFADNLLDDIELEYRLTERDNMFATLYRKATRASILEGEVTETGGGFKYRKKIARLRDLFKRRRKDEKK